MKKRGQVTIFIVLAVLLIVIILAVFLVKFSPQKKEKTSAEKVYSFVEECLTYVSYDALVYMANTGGYFVIANDSTEEGIAYYYLNDKNLVPSRQELGKEFSLYLENFLPFCTADFSFFPDYAITEEEPEANVFIADDKLSIKLSFPITAQKGEEVIKLENFETEIPFRYGIINTAANKITQSLIESEICISCVNDIAREHDLLVNIIHVDEDFIVSLTDPHSQVYEQNYTFYFAGK